MEQMVSMDSLDLWYETESRSIVEGGALEFKWDVILDDEYAANNNEQQIELISGYHFYLKNVGDPRQKMHINFSAYCIQDPDIQQQIQEDRIQRFICRMDTFDCKGSITGFINKQQKWIHLEFKHEIQHAHPTINERNTMPAEIRQHIEQHAENLDPAHLYRTIREQFDGATMVTQAQVYRMYHSCVEDLYRSESDQFASTQTLVRRHQSDGFEEVKKKKKKAYVGWLWVGVFDRKQARMAIPRNFSYIDWCVQGDRHLVYGRPTSE
jgi:hypothetical protein